MSDITKEPIDEIRMNLMKQGEEGEDYAAISDIKNKVYDKNWKIYKERADKSLPNNKDVVKRIEQSIRDGITSEDLVKRCKELNDRVLK